MKKTAIAAALLLATGAVNAATVTSLDVSGGLFNMGAPVYNADGTVNGASSVIGAHTMNMGVYTGDEAEITAANVAGTLPTTGYVNWAFGYFGNVTNFSTAASNQAGVVGGGPVLSGETDDAMGTITLDLSSFFANWNGTSFNQGSAGTVGTYDATTGDFTVGWNQLIVGGAFDGKTGYWELSGTANVAAVPVPAAVWLFGSGLVGLAGVARRRKAA